MAITDTQKYEACKESDFIQASASSIQFFSKPFAFSDSSVLKQTDVVSVTAAESI